MFLESKMRCHVQCNYLRSLFHFKNGLIKQLFFFQLHLIESNTKHVYCVHWVRKANQWSLSLSSCPFVPTDGFSPLRSCLRRFLAALPFYFAIQPFFFPVSSWPSSSAVPKLCTEARKQKNLLEQLNIGPNGQFESVTVEAFWGKKTKTITSASCFILNLNSYFLVNTQYVLRY